MKNETDFKEEELEGKLSITLANNQTLSDFCSSKIPGYNADRLNAMAIRVYVGDETIITVFAVDKSRQDNSTINSEKIPVKKFKLENVSLDEVLAYCKSFNCTISTQNYSLEDMEIINK